MLKLDELLNQVFILVILVSSCQSANLPKKGFLGKYQNTVIYGVESNITLKTNHSFIYNWQMGLLYGTTTGNWKLDGNQLVLNSNLQPSKEDNFTTQKRTSTNTKQFEIKVIEKNWQEELLFVDCLSMNDTLILDSTSTDFDGNCMLPVNEHANKLVFLCVGYKTVEIPISQLTSNSFILEMKLKNEPYVYFTNQKWKFKRGKLYTPNIKNGYYKKVEN